jgi:LPS sulfotransferase NodH
VRLTARAIRKMLTTVDAEEAHWDAFIRQWPEPPVVVAYEDLAADYEGTACAVAAALGIDTPHPVVFGERRLVAQADALTERWVARLRRLKHERVRIK